MGGFAKRLGVLSAVLTAVGIAAVATGRITSDRRITEERQSLLGSARADSPSTVVESEIEPLPEPVRRWLRYAGVVGRPRAAIVRIQQEGDFRLSEDRGWMPFTAEQWYTTDPPGFLWSVQMEFAPLVPVRGRDRYYEGEGSIEMRLLWLVPVANKHGGELNQGALLRYLNETMWFPSAALNPYIRWDAIDDGSAKATMTYGGITASAIFYFDGQGRLTTMTADRYNDSQGRIERWSTPITTYGEFGGLRLPSGGEGIWHYESGDFSYIRLRITEVEINPTK